MDSIYYEKLLYRILQGRLKLRLDDLVLFISEPTAELLEESLDIYDKAYQQAYYMGVPIKDQLVEILLDNNIWSPLDDSESESLENQIENTKVQAFEKFYDKRLVNTLKMNIRELERKLLKTKMKKVCLDHTSCEGVASFSRSLWILSRTTFYKDKTPYDWQHMTVHNLFDKYMENQISHKDIRYLARKEPWRGIWLIGKKSGNIFDREVINTTKDQILLSHYSSMYDNIYEHPECPNDKIVDDDDILDGWMIKQKRENEKSKKQKEVDSLTKNPKIANSQEVFIMAKDQESANEIYGLNNPMARKTISDRKNQIINSEEGQIDFRQLSDVRQDIQVQSHKQALEGIKGKGRS